jgi:hypothetical protein
MVRFMVSVIAIALIANSARSEARLAQDMHELPDACFSDDEFDRGTCFGYMQASIMFNHRGFPKNDVDCFLGEVYALRNVALHGWEKISETLEWSHTEEGRETIGARRGEWALERTRDLAESAQKAREAIAARQAGGSLPAVCVISLRMQGLWDGASAP